MCPQFGEGLTKLKCARPSSNYNMAVANLKALAPWAPTHFLSEK